MVREGRSSGGLERRVGDSEMCSDCGLGSLKHLESGRARGWGGGATCFADPELIRRARVGGRLGRLAVGRMLCWFE